MDWRGCVRPEELSLSSISPRNGKDKLTKLAKPSQPRITDGGNRRLECHTEQKSASELPGHSVQLSTPHWCPVAPRSWPSSFPALSRIGAALQRQHCRVMSQHTRTSRGQDTSANTTMS